MPGGKKSTAGRWRARVWLALLIGSLTAVFGSNFSAPLRSDWWCLLHYFHSWRDLPAFERALEVINYDICGHGTYRPLFHVVLYWMHLLFGAEWFRFHVLNFAFYCLSILLLYRLARRLGAGRTVTLAFLTVFAFLFSHFDIVVWTFHIAVIAGFCLCLLGFLGYLSYLRRSRVATLLGAAVILLAGILCYETFILWPPAVVLLLYREKRPAAARFRSLLRATVFALAGLYAAYSVIISYAHSRSQIKGLAGARPGILSAPSLSYTIALTASGLAFNTAASNLCLFLVSPGIIRDNISRGGVLIAASPALREERAFQAPVSPPSLREPPLKIGKELDLDALWLENERSINLALGLGGCLILLAGIFGAIRLWKRRQPRRPLPFIFILYLLLTGTFLLYHGRLATNIPLYVLLEFRYQYVPNALVFLLAILGADRLFRAHPRLRIYLYPAMTGLAGIHLLVLSVHLAEVNRQLEPLARMLANIRAAVDDGRVNPGRKLYLDDNIVDSLPPLCWNANLHPFMQGTYQWIFPRERIDCFAFDPAEAAWTIDTGSFKLKEMIN